MKKIILSITFFGAFVFFGQLRAQPHVSVHVGIHTQPDWIPSGYDRADYYYLPDIGAYYYVPKRQFIYSEAGRWVFATSLPLRYRSYDLHAGRKIVINEPRPYLRNDFYRKRYGGHRAGYHSRKVLPHYRNRTVHRDIYGRRHVR